MLTGSLYSLKTVQKNTPNEKEVVSEYSDFSFNLGKLLFSGKYNCHITQSTLECSFVVCALNSI